MDLVRMIEHGDDTWMLFRCWDGYLLEHTDQDGETTSIPMTSLAFELMALDVQADQASQTPIPDYRQNVIQYRRTA